MGVRIGFLGGFRIFLKFKKKISIVFKWVFVFCNDFFIISIYFN